MAKNYKDVTNEVLGTKNDPVKPAPSKKEDSVIANGSSTEGLEIPEGFEPLNPPVPSVPPVKNKKELTVSAETMDGLKAMDRLFRNATKNFVEIGFELYRFQKRKAYKELGFKTFDEFVRSQFNLSRSAAYNFIKVCVRFSVRDEDGEPTRVLGKEYTRYTCSQLSSMLSLDDEVILNVDPDTAVREIKKLTKKPDKNKDSADEDVEADVNDLDDDSEQGSGSDLPDDKPKRRNTRDVMIPVCRISMASGLSWDEVVTDKIRNVCEYYLADDKRKEDGNDYKIEICITYPDKSAI